MMPGGLQSFGRSGRIAGTFISNSVYESFDFNSSFNNVFSFEENLFYVFNLHSERPQRGKPSIHPFKHRRSSVIKKQAKSV